MSNRDAAILVVVGAAALAGITAVAMLQATVVLVGAGETGLMGRVFALIPSLFLAWSAVQLVRYRVRLSEMIFPDSAPADPPADRRSWQMLGVVVIGLQVLVLSLPEFLTWAVDVLAEVRGEQTAWQEATGANAMSLGRVVSALADTAIAGWLLVQRDVVVDRLFPSDVPQE